jgi:hypothetical protein
MGNIELYELELVFPHCPVNLRIPGWCFVKKTRERYAVREMKADPSEPAGRRRLQTAMTCFGQNARW